MTDQYDSLYFADLVEPIKQSEIMPAIGDDDWQSFRKSLKGLTTASKLRRLRTWKREHPGRQGTVQVANYVNALKRGGQLK